MTYDTRPPTDRPREAAGTAEVARPTGPTGFRIAVDQDLVIVRARGELDMAAEAAFEEHLRLAFSRRPAVIVDASDVTFADCSALRVLIAVGAEMTSRGRRWCVVASPVLQRLFALARVRIPTMSSVDCARSLGISPH